MRLGQSVLDTVLDETRRVHKSLGSGDREKLDQYMTAVATSKGGCKRPRPGFIDLSRRSKSSARGHPERS